MKKIYTLAYISSLYVHSLSIFLTMPLADRKSSMLALIKTYIAVLNFAQQLNRPKASHEEDTCGINILVQQAVRSEENDGAGLAN
jgi:hypothetical protein